MHEQEQKFTAVSRQDWSLHRRGAQDEARHNEKVKEAIKGNLEQVISDGSIITVDPSSKKIVKVPMRSVELPRFKFKDSYEGIGSGKGEGPGNGPEAGDQPGVEYYETEMTIEELQEMVFADLGLPRIKPKDDHQIETEDTVFKDIRKKRSPNNLDIGRTVLQNMLRNAQETGIAQIKGISPDDYRVRTWEEEVRSENNAVVLAMADISGSMGDFEKYITRAFCWWTVGFLRSKYPKVDIVFIAHDTQAYEVNEEQFFTRGVGGGTKCSSANELALDIVKNRYPSSRYNVYPLHFSDGDNWSGDNEKCIELVNQLLDRDINQYAYIQINNRQQGQSKLLSEYNKNIPDDRFKGLMINDKAGVLAALKKVFNPQDQTA